MKMKVKKIVIFTFFCCLILMPILLMIKMSKKEMSKYHTNDTYQFKEVAYGTPCMVTRQDIQQYYMVSGVVTSNTYCYIDIENKLDKKIRMDVSVGDEISKGEIIGYVGDDEIISLYDGIVEDIVVYSDAYIKVLSFDEKVLTCMIDIDKALKLKEINNFYLEDGSKITINSISNISENNQVKVVFNIENIEYIYGQVIEELKIYTGKIFENVLVVDASCVYQKNQTGPYYVRVLDDYGFFLEEKKVEIGFNNGNVVSVLNIDEGTLCDSGYKNVVSYYME